MRTRSATVIVCALVLGVCAPTRAVIIEAGDGSGNTTAPTAPGADPGFANIGVRGVGTAVYLGGGWVITDQHVGAGAVYFNNVAYQAVANSTVQLANAPNSASLSDLIMFRLQSPPNLPSIAISNQPPATGWNVTMIGNGRDRQPSEYGWTSTWAPAVTPAFYNGYAWSTNGYQHIRWGTNVISAVSQPVTVGSYAEAGFTTTFDNLPNSNEAQGASGDSGGGVFYQNPNTHQWLLAGLMATVYSSAAGEPWNVCLFGDSTAMADLNYYRSEIYQNMAPGDLNGDGVVNIADLTYVGSNWMNTGTGNNPFPAGDANNDGVVDIGDLTYLGSHWGDTYNIAQIATGGTGQSVPEPSTLLLLAAGLVSYRLFFRRRNRG